MSNEPILLTRADGVATLTLNRPDALNAFTEPMHAALKQALDTVEADPSVRALLITGAGRAFCAGQDLNERKREEGAPPPDLGDTLGRLYNPMIRRLAAFRVPTIAAVNGVAAGAGCSLALTCDLVFAARAAKFLFAFAKIGLVPDSGATWALPRLVGRAKAAGLALTAETIDAEEAERIGLIWKVVDDAALMQTAQAQARQFAAGPTLGLGHIKQLLAASQNNELDAQLDLERDTQRELGRSHDYAEGTRAFLEKRKPVYRGE